MKFEVRNRWSDEVQFTAEIEAGDDAPTSIKLGLAIKWAVKARAYLTDANLAGANLTGAYLVGAYLAGAYLAGAYLTDANLADANLADANLADAYLADANLADANLTGAYLAGANLADANLADANLADANLADANLARANLAGAKIRLKTGKEALLIGKRPLLQIGPIGSRSAMLSAYVTDAGPMLQTGCFGPAPLAEFINAVGQEHGDNTHAHEYLAAVALIEAHAKLWAPEAVTKEAAE